MAMSPASLFGDEGKRHEFVECVKKELAEFTSDKTERRNIQNKAYA